MLSVPKPASSPKTRRSLWFERGMALLALVNFGIVLFDLTYISARDFYLQEAPALTRLYDPVKGIEVHRDTQQYLDTVQQLQTEVATNGLRSPESSRLLDALQTLSTEMIENNPFALAGKTGTLEQIKNRLRERLKNESAKQSFRTFWSRDYLLTQGWTQEIEFFNTAIKPLIASNYYRGYGEHGGLIDRFYLIDVWFIGIFGLEFLVRTYIIHRRYVSLTWFQAMLWRWYDLFLLLPFWRWFRAIPVLVRLNQAELLNLEPVKEQASQGFVATIAEDLTEVVVVRIINQMQESVKRGEISKWFTQGTSRQYIDLNNVNEIEAIADLLIKITVRKVIPEVLPDIEALLRHNIDRILNQSPFYQGFQKLPAIGALPQQLTDRLVNDLSQAAYQTLNGAIEDDPVGAELSRRLIEHLMTAIGSELQKQQTTQKLQNLVNDFLEEVKLNYVQRLSDEDVEKVLEETRAIRQITQ